MSYFYPPQHQTSLDDDDGGFMARDRVSFLTRPSSGGYTFELTTLDGAECLTPLPSPPPPHHYAKHCNGTLKTANHVETASGAAGRAEANGPTSRKGLAAMLAGVVAVVALLGLVLPLAMQLSSSSLLEARLAFIKRLVAETPLIDGHVQPAPNLTDTLVSALLWPVLVPCGSQHLDAVQLTLEKMDEMYRFVQNRSSMFETAFTSEEFEAIHMNGRIAVLLGVEGGHSLGDSLGVLRSLYTLGARFLTLTHECNTPWAQAAASPTRIVTVFTPSGLTTFGRSMVLEMNRLGMLVDLSHVSERAMHDVLDVAQAPVIFSHSGARALCNSSIHVPDSVLTRLALNGGVVMVSTEGCTGDQQSAYQTMIEHINHIRQTAGVNHVGLSADSAGTYPLLLSELARDRAWETASIRKLVGLNFVRVLREVETFRSGLKGRHSVPIEEDANEIMDLDIYCRYPDGEEGEL